VNGIPERRKKVADKRGERIPSISFGQLSQASTTLELVCGGQLEKCVQKKSANKRQLIGLKSEARFSFFSFFRPQIPAEKFALMSPKRVDKWPARHFSRSQVQLPQLRLSFI